MAADRTHDHIAHRLLSQAHPPELADAIFTEKVLYKPLLLRPTSPDPTSQDARARRRLQRLRKNEHARRRQKPKPLSAKEKRVLGIYDIPNEAQKYEIYVPLHRMWVEYMREILGMAEGRQTYLTAQSVGGKLASADFHGAELEVVRSKCVGRVGCKGIVVKDTKFTFEMITKDNVLKNVPKCHTLFRFEVPQHLKEGANAQAGISVEAGEMSQPLPTMVFELHGSQFENRATDRATKKFKQRRLDDL